MITVKKLGFILILFFSIIALANQSDTDGLDIDDKIMNLTTDSRIKTYIYSPNDVYLLVLQYGFQLNVEFAKNERVQTISLGDNYAWKITPLDNLLFIRPLERNIRTNMTIITNKNTYYFDLVSHDDEDDLSQSDQMYLVRFYYPK
jgi:type IV secretion system protein VirB9